MSTPVISGFVFVEGDGIGAGVPYNDETGAYRSNGLTSLTAMLSQAALFGPDGQQWSQLERLAYTYCIAAHIYGMMFYEPMPEDLPPVDVGTGGSWVIWGTPA